ncbi:PREDICTED: myb-like protein X [Nicotiana attenuata]|uniref:myb-like protein X n=1 Tax=Nicotiana attenuata TaxID=49451 RepID=UPI0009048FFF|nr:PREDICTED: myb-like protein X [Nicotiana attenuata]
MGENIVGDTPQNNRKRKKSSGQKNNPSKKRFDRNCYDSGKAGHEYTDCCDPKKNKKKGQENMVEKHGDVDDLVLEKKKAKEKEEDDRIELDKETQLDSVIEASKQAVNDNRENHNSPSLESDQNQQKENREETKPDNTSKKNKRKKTKKMLKKKSKLLLKPVQSNQGNDIDLNNNDKITKEDDLNTKEEQLAQNNPRQNSNQEVRIEEKDNLEQYCCDTNSSTVPTEIRNQPGLQLVVDLYGNKKDRDNSKLVEDNTDNLQMIEHPYRQKEVRNEDLDFQNHNEEQQHMTRRRRSETRKNGKRHRNNTHPSMRRSKKKDTTPNCSDD